MDLCIRRCTSKWYENEDAVMPLCETLLVIWWVKGLEVGLVLSQEPVWPWQVQGKRVHQAFLRRLAPAGALVAVLEIRGGVLCCEFVEEVVVGVGDEVMREKGMKLRKRLISRFTSRACCCRCHEQRDSGDASSPCRP